MMNREFPLIVLKQKNKSLLDENIRLREQLQEKEEKLRQDEEWINRLQEFMDIEEEERNAILADIKAKKAGRELLSAFLMLKP